MWTALEDSGQDREWKIGGKTRANAELLNDPTKAMKLPSCGITAAMVAKRLG